MKATTTFHYSFSGGLCGLAEKKINASNTKNRNQWKHVDDDDYDAHDDDGRDEHKQVHNLSKQQTDFLSNTDQSTFILYISILSIKYTIYF